MNVIRIVVSALALVPIACFAKGPIGIGKLEVGVSRSAVEGLSPTDGVYLAALWSLTNTNIQVQCRARISLIRRSSVL